MANLLLALINIAMRDGMRWGLACADDGAASNPSGDSVGMSVDEVEHESVILFGEVAGV